MQGRTEKRGEGLLGLGVSTFLRLQGAVNISGVRLVEAPGPVVPHRMPPCTCQPTATPPSFESIHLNQWRRPACGPSTGRPGAGTSTPPGSFAGHHNACVPTCLQATDASGKQGRVSLSTCMHLYCLLRIMHVVWVGHAHNTAQRRGSSGPVVTLGSPTPQQLAASQRVARRAFTLGHCRSLPNRCE